MTLKMCPDDKWVSYYRVPKIAEIQFFHRGVGINRPQNGLSRNGRVNFFRCPKILGSELQFDGKALSLQALCLPDGWFQKGL